MASTTKRVRIEPNDMLKELKEMFDRRMQALERKMEFLINTCTTILGSCDFHKKGDGSNNCCAQLILPKIKVIDNYIRSVKNKDSKEKNDCSAPILLLPNGTNCNVEPQIIELNSEDDLPSGSWLGDEDNPQTRVRVPITPEKLKEINVICLTPEKMALTLLDFLFPREVLAVSNLSGKGKHSKKQLDPLLIYAIRCHLFYKFDITEQDWHRIKQNMDSKCRSVWKKTNAGLLLTNNNNNNNNKFNHHIEINSSKPFDNGLHSISEDLDHLSNSNSSVCLRRSESRSNSPLKNISTLPSIMEEDLDFKDFTDGDFFHFLLPNGKYEVDVSDCFNLDSKTDTIDLIPDKLFGDGVLDCDHNLDS